MEDNIKTTEFDKIAANGVCEVCGKHGKIVVVSSRLGPTSNIICKECLKDGLEPIGNIAGFLTVHDIYSYESLRKDKGLFMFVESQMQARNASDEDWDMLWEAIRNAKEIMANMAEEGK